MSYRIQLKLRLEDVKSYNVPKQCSSCFRKPAPQRRVLTARHRVNRQARVQWTIQLPLCETCYQMEHVLHNYRPSQHGPPERAQGNRRAVLALTALLLLAIASLWLPETFVPWLSGPNRFFSLLVLGLIAVGLYYWNWRASQRARLAIYRDLVDRAGYEFGEVEVEDGKQGPILIFDNEAFGRAFEKSNQGLVSTDRETD